MTYSAQYEGMDKFFFKRKPGCELWNLLTGGRVVGGATREKIPGTKPTQYKNNFQLVYELSNAERVIVTEDAAV